jgi:hypothetical protein
VDGVLLGKRDRSSPDVVLARHAGEFLKLALDGFDCYWLTTHCQGSTAAVLRYLDPYADPAIRSLLRAIKPTSFRTLKTEALRGDFTWLDDAPLAAERAWLREHGWEKRWIDVNTRKRPGDLLRVMELLSARCRANRGASSAAVASLPRRRPG